MIDEPQEKGSSLWEKVSDTVVKGIKTGKEEIVRTSKMGKIRLEISAIKSRIGDKQKELGGQAYNLWLAKKVSIAELERMFDQIKQLEDEIKQKENEIESMVKEKVVVGEKPVEPATHVEESPLASKQEKSVAEEKAEKPATKQKVAKKASAKKINADNPTNEPKSS